MLDGERIPGKSVKSSKNNVGNTSSNNVFSSSEIEEEDGDFAGPSTSNYKNNEAAIDDLSHYTEDLDVNEHRSKRELFAEFRRLLDHDSVFHRIRSDILDDLERMAQEQTAMEHKQLSHRQHFEFLEWLDDILDNKNDLNLANLAILRNSAIQLSKHAPLEVMSSDFDLEHLFVVPEKRKENMIEEELISPPKKTRKSRNVDEPSVISQKTTQPADDFIKIDVSTQLTINDNDKIGSKEVKESLREPKSNGLSSSALNGEKSNGKSDISRESPSKSIELEKPTGKSAFIDNIEIEELNKKASSTKIESDQSSNVDSKETRSNEKVKKTESKKLIKKPIKPNGVSKTPKTEKGSNRRASEPESTKLKRRVVVPVPEPINETSGRQSSQRRTTRNTQPNSELTNIDEQTYCLCDQISFGNMIGCDNDRCNIEWFHFDCVGLKVKPGKGQKWYCPTCRGEKSNVMKSTTRR